MILNRTELKITIAKLLELAYSEDKGLTAKIIRSKGGFKLVVDSDGKATLSASIGVLTFSGAPVLNKLGVKIKRVSVNFSDDVDMKVKYEASFSLEVLSMSVSGRVDIEELITSCSALLCQAAKAMKQRHVAYESELERLMGR